MNLRVRSVTGCSRSAIFGGYGEISMERLRKEPKAVTTYRNCFVIPKW